MRGGRYEVIHMYAKANNKYIKSYDKNIESCIQTHVFRRK